jgi:hypothetical protein
MTGVAVGNGAGNVIGVGVGIAVSVALILESTIDRTSASLVPQATPRNAKIRSIHPAKIREIICRRYNRRQYDAIYTHPQRDTHPYPPRHPTSYRGSHEPTTPLSQRLHASAVRPNDAISVHPVGTNEHV